MIPLLALVKESDCELSLELKTELLMAINDYESRDIKEWDSGLDITALDSKSNDKILLRMITKPESKSGYVSADAVDKMAAVIQNEDYDKGILIGGKFTKAAQKKLEEEGIQRVSENFVLDCSPDRLYSAARDFVDSQCMTRCGRIPLEESDCKGHLNGQYSCQIRLISDNVSFHFERGWTSLLEKDVLRLVSINHSAGD